MVGGELVMALAEATGARSIPVDSEHSALFQLLEGQRPGTVDRLVLTACGGPFRGRTPDLDGVTREEALAHPTWDMGGKITIDSATLMNKGLELIEAHHLFGVPLRPDRRGGAPAVDRPRAGAAQRRRVAGAPGLPGHARADLLRAAPPRARRRAGARRSTSPSSAQLTFEPPDDEHVPLPARWPARPRAAGGTAPCVLNAANEVAVQAFLDGELPFTGIARGDRARRWTSCRAAAGAPLLRPLRGRRRRRASARELRGRWRA